MNKLRTIFSGKQHLLIMMSFVMLIATGYRPVDLSVLGIGSTEIYLQAENEDELPTEGITIQSAAYEAIVPVYKIQMGFVYNTILELHLLEEIVENVKTDLPLPQSSYFRILFRTFISPNAP